MKVEWIAGFFFRVMKRSIQRPPTLTQIGNKKKKFRHPSSEVIGRPKKPKRGKRGIGLFIWSNQWYAEQEELCEPSIPTYLSMSSREVWVAVSLLLLTSFCLRVNTFNNNKKKKRKKNYYLAVDSEYRRQNVQEKAKFKILFPWKMCTAWETLAFLVQKLTLATYVLKTANHNVFPYLLMRSIYPLFAMKSKNMVHNKKGFCVLPQPAALEGGIYTAQPKF